MSQILDDGKIIAFGQSLEEIEQLFGCKAVDTASRISRKGIDQSLKCGNVALQFDSGRLKNVGFEQGYGFGNPLTPYPEDWKNLPPIGEARISKGMSREQFLAYLKVWADRAKGLGAEPVEPDEDLSGQQYWIWSERDTFADMAGINMGPSRRARGGGLWCDSWCVFFTLESDHEHSGVEVGRLRSLSAFRDEFNTVARRLVAAR